MAASRPKWRVAGSHLPLASCPHTVFPSVGSDRTGQEIATGARRVCTASPRSSRWKRPFEFSLGTSALLQAGVDTYCSRNRVGWFLYFQDAAAIAVEPVQEIARTNGPEMVQKRFCFRQDAWVLATYTTGSTGQRPWLR